ncbi:hypothetical protein HMPREF2935_10215 [Corynebacterium sp. HMSC076D02]|nr:hypothetical protein HMPREF2935_10215 [Corynebacterium sp. HMSC076D02]
MEGEAADDVGSVVLVVEVGAGSELVDVIEDVVDSGVVVDSFVSVVVSGETAVPRMRSPTQAAIIHHQWRFNGVAPWASRRSCMRYHAPGKRKTRPTHIPARIPRKLPENKFPKMTTPPRVAAVQASTFFHVGALWGGGVGWAPYSEKGLEFMMELSFWGQAALVW